jgi:hypothetical protein
MADEKQYLSRVRLIDGTTVDVKDQEARSILDSLSADVQALADGQVTINKKDIASLLDQMQWGEFF